MRCLYLLWFAIPLISCSQTRADPQESLFACDFPGVQDCESILHIAVGPADLPRANMIFQVYDLRAPEGDRLSFYFTDQNHPELEIRNPSDFDGRSIEFRDIFNLKADGAPYVHLVEDLLSEDIRLWHSTGGSVSPIYDVETRSFFVEWDLKLVSTQEPPPDPVERHEKGWARAPVIVECWKRIEPGLSQQDVNFETEFCKPWKAYSTDHR